MEKKFSEYNSPIPATKVESTAYQCELKKLQKYYGFRVTPDSYGQAQWDREGAFARLKPWNEFWLQVEAAKDIMGTDFAKKVHILLSADKLATEIIKELGRFEDYQKEYLATNGKGRFNDEICCRLKRSGKWWLRSYYGD